MKIKNKLLSILPNSLLNLLGINLPFIISSPLTDEALIEFEAKLLPYIQKNDLETVKTLITSEIKLSNFKDSITISIKNNNLNLLKFFLSLKKYDYELDGFLLTSSLLESSSKIEMMDFLIHSGADIRCFGDYPLRWNSHGEDFESMIYLFNHYKNKNLEKVAQIIINQ